MTVNDRVRELRKHLNLTQVEFADRIRISQGHLTSVETGTRAVTSKFIKMLHLEFGVREEWLFDGTGEMFEDSGDDFVSELASKYNLDSLQQSLVRAVYEMPQEYRTMILNVARKLVAENENVPAETDEERTKRIVRSARAARDAEEGDQDERA